MDKVLGDKIPEFNRKDEADGAGLSGLGSLRASAATGRAWKPW